MISLDYLYGIGFRDYLPRLEDSNNQKLLIWYGSLYNKSFVVIVKVLTNSFEVDRLVLDNENSKEVFSDIFGEVWNFDDVLSFIEKLMFLPPDFRENHTVEKFTP